MKVNVFMVALMVLYTMPLVAQTGQKNDAEPSDGKILPAKYCLSFNDYKENNWTDLDSVCFISRSAKQKVLWGGSDFNFKSTDKKIDELLKKQAFAVLFDDSLYVNVHGLKHKGARFGNGYTHGYVFVDGRILFLEQYVSKKRNMSIGALAGAAGVVAGAAGGAIVGASTIPDLHKKVCYLISSDNKEIESLGEETLPELLSSNPELLDEYNKVEGKKEKRSAAVVVPLLIKSGLLKNEK